MARELEMDLVGVSSLRHVSRLLLLGLVQEAFHGVFDRLSDRQPSAQKLKFAEKMRMTSSEVWG
jgi:hypothetical protein